MSIKTVTNTPTEASDVEMTSGAFLFASTDPQRQEPPPCTVYLSLGRYIRTDGGPIATVYGVCCNKCRWPRLTLSYVMTNDPDEVANRYSALEAEERLYECPGCGSSHIRPPKTPGDTFHCGHCGRVVELVNVRDADIAKAYFAYLRQKNSIESSRYLPGARCNNR